MAMVEFTPRAEENLLHLLGQNERSNETLLVVDVSTGAVELSLKNTNELDSLQRDVDMVGPFRVPIGGQQLSLFVRDGESAPGGVYELDCNSHDGKRCFEIRTTK